PYTTIFRSEPGAFCSQSRRATRLRYAPSKDFCGLARQPCGMEGPPRKSRRCHSLRPGVAHGAVAEPAGELPVFPQWILQRGAVSMAVRSAFRRSLAVAGVAASLALTGCAGSGDTGLGLNLVSAEQVEQLGIESWERLKAETPRSTNKEYQATLQKVGSRVLSAIGENPAAWEMVVFQGDEANAFALPGNKIGVFEGMFQYAKTEAQLAAIVGHEIAHNQRNH